MKRPVPDDVYMQIVTLRRTLDSTASQINVLEKGIKGIIDYLAKENAYVEELEARKEKE